MSNTFLQEQNQGAESKGSITKYQLKIQHLNDLNKKIYMENEQLRSKINFLQNQKKIFLESHLNENLLISNLTKQIEIQKHKNSILSKKNEQLLATILLNQQMNIQARKQSEFYVSRYEHKILELRQSLQLKQLQIQTLQEKYQKIKGLHLPMSTKNANRYTCQILKYQNLIQQMISQRNKEQFRNLDELSNVIMKFNNQSQNSSKTNKKEKSKKQSCNTDIRSNLNHLATDSTMLDSLNQQKLDIIVLRLHIELRDLKVKLHQKMEVISELKNKDKVMKQGYMTLTRQIQKVKVQNCQLKIQLEHLDKKFKTSKDLLKAKSDGNIMRRLRQPQNVEQQILSNASIQGNLCQAKQYLKVTLPSETKHDTFSTNKSHNFDEKIENIEGLLSLDSSPDFKNMMNKKEIAKYEEEDEEELSICEENETNEADLSISLDASGFVAPSKSNHEISEHFLNVF